MLFPKERLGWHVYGEKYNVYCRSGRLVGTSNKAQVSLKV